MIRRDRFLDYVDRFRSRRVLVVGTAVAEIDVHCSVTRLAPDRAMPVYRCERRTVHPGGAALTAATIANLGGQVTLLAPMDRESIAGSLLREALIDAGVEVFEAGLEGAHPPELLRHLAQGRQMLQIRRGWQPRGFVDLAEALDSCLKGPGTCGDETPWGAVIVVDAEPASLTADDLAAVQAAVRRLAVPLIFDAAGADLPLPAGSAAIDHLIVNERESRVVAPAAPPSSAASDDHIERLRSLCARVSPTVLLTLGRHGAVLGRRGSPHDDAAARNGSGGDACDCEVHPLTPPAHALADRRGVGYVLSGVYAAAIAAGADPEEAAFLACGGASFAASIAGPKRLQIDDLLRIAYREIESQVADGIEVFSRIKENHLPIIDRAARVLMEAYNEGRQVLVFGNGGSAAEANHLVGELTGRFKHSRPGLPAISLSANDSLTTCLANDYGYEDVFARQIDTFCREGDVVIGLSTSGKSANVVRALERARSKGARSIAFTGHEPGPMGQLADVVINVPSRTTARIQEAHLFVIHVLCEMLDSRLDAQGRLHPSASEM